LRYNVFRRFCGKFQLLVIHYHTAGRRKARKKRKEFGMSRRQAEPNSGVSAFQASSATLRSILVDLKPERAVRQLFVTSYVSHTTATHLIHYPASKTVFILPLPRESVPVQCAWPRKLTTSCLFFIADLKNAIHGFHFADRRLSQLPTLQAVSSSNHIYQSRTAQFLPFRRH